ncbi:hypothetical protein RN001_000441 [Aquatica leii]|uniref:Uncharacterized protein n=1 Tax=Aquatica leii TaxID=1421715 RepID=A0AAN7P9Y9_9COLE|nr:hypothetical protein RN001_000441 [Aquatica leii]
MILGVTLLQIEVVLRIKVNQYTCNSFIFKNKTKILPLAILNPTVHNGYSLCIGLYVLFHMCYAFPMRITR